MIVDRVVLGRFAPRAAGWLGVVVGLYAVADLADALSHPLPWSRLPLRLWAMTFQGLPVALAAAVAHTVTALRRSGEWTGLSAAGVGGARGLAPIALVASLAALVSWGIGDRLAPAAARDYRAAGGGPPPGAVVLPMPAAGWSREGSTLSRAGDAPLRIRFGPGEGPPVIDTTAAPSSWLSPTAQPPGAAAGVSSRLVRPLPASTDVSRAELLALGARAGDALPYALEAAFRPLVAAAALLLPLLVLGLVGPRALGPRAAALATVVVCLGAYAVVAVAFALAAVGVVKPPAAALGAATSIAGATVLAALSSRRAGR